MLYGAIEAGGTKFVVAVGEEDGTIVKRVAFPTEQPEITMVNVYEFFEAYRDQLVGIGIGSFGPIDIRKESDTYGYITQTPKLAWRNYDFVGNMKAVFDLPIGFTTDVNAAALGEVKLGAAADVESCIYLTVGTGIGGGAVVNGKILEGYSHPEMGHLLIGNEVGDDFVGTCPSHKNCLEGLAAGSAIEARWGKKGIELSDEEAVWDLEASYLAKALYNYTLILAPERIVLGGGVMKQRQLFSLIRKKLIELNNDYIELPDLDAYIVPPKLEDDAGITGCILLAIEASKAE